MSDTFKTLWTNGANIKYQTIMDLYQLRVILAFFPLEVFVSQTGAEAKTACNLISYPSSAISLECNTNEWIHVKSLQIGQRKPDQGCVDKTNSCTKTQNSNQNGLFVTCNGQMKCSEYIQALSSPFSCPNVSGIEIEYECIKDSINVCSEVDIQSEEGIIHLHSPGFPNSERVNGSCNCRIDGTLMTVTVLEHRVGDDVVTISTYNAMTRLLGTIDLYNYVIATRTTAVDLTYENNGTTGSVWIRIIGSGPLHVQCNKGILNLNTSNYVTPSTSAPLTDIISQQSTSGSSSTASRETETNAPPISTSSGTFPTSGMSTSTSTSTDMDTAESDTTTHIPTSSVNNTIPTSSIQKIPQTETSADPAGPSTPAMTTIQTTLIYFTTPDQDTSSAATAERASSSSSIASNTTNDGSTDDINIAAIVGGLCGVILLLLVIISLLVYFKVIEPTRNHPSAQKTDIRNEQDMTVSYAHYEDVTDLSDSPTHDGALEVSRHTSNPYDDLSRYENHGVHEYGQLHLYEGAETRVEPSQDNRTYSGLSNYVNHGDHHNYGEIHRNN